MFDIINLATPVRNAFIGAYQYCTSILSEDPMIHSLMDYLPKDIDYIGKHFAADRLHRHFKQLRVLLNDDGLSEFDFLTAIDISLARRLRQQDRLQEDHVFAELEFGVHALSPAVYLYELDQLRLHSKMKGYFVAEQRVETVLERYRQSFAKNTDAIRHNFNIDIYALINDLFHMVISVDRFYGIIEQYASLVSAEFHQKILTVVEVFVDSYLSGILSDDLPSLPKAELKKFLKTIDYVWREIDLIRLKIPENVDLMEGRWSPTVKKRTRDVQSSTIGTIWNILNYVKNNPMKIITAGVATQVVAAATVPINQDFYVSAIDDSYDGIDAKIAVFGDGGFVVQWALTWPWSESVGMAYFNSSYDLVHRFICDPVDRIYANLDLVAVDDSTVISLARYYKGSPEGMNVNLFATDPKHKAYLYSEAPISVQNLGAERNGKTFLIEPDIIFVAWDSIGPATSNIRGVFYDYKQQLRLSDTFELLDRRVAASDGFELNTCCSFDFDLSLIDQNQFALVRIARLIDYHTVMAFISVFYTNGTLAQSEVPILPNTQSYGASYSPVLETSPDNRLVAAWYSTIADESSGGVFFTQYSASLNLLRQIERVNTQTLGIQAVPDIAMMTTGHFLIVWQGENPLGGIYGFEIYGQLFSQNGTALYDEFVINDEKQYHQVIPRAATLPGNKIFVVWNSAQEETSDSECVFDRADFSTGRTCYSLYHWEVVGKVLDLSDIPDLYNNQMSINEGGSIFLTTDNLAAHARDVDDAHLEFTLIDVEHGIFFWVNTTEQVVSFTQAEFWDGTIVFQHDGSESAPSYKVKVSSSSYLNTPLPAEISFTNVNDAPVIVINKLRVFEGQIAVLNELDLRATDVDSNTDATVFLVDAATQGQFEVIIAPGIRVFNFTQLEVRQRDVWFVHNGGEVAPTYTLRAFDGLDYSEPSEAQIEFITDNDPPVLLNNQLVVVTGETVVLSGANFLADDNDHTVNQLQFSISSVQNGQFELLAQPGVAVTQFTQLQVSNAEVQFVHDGSAQAPSYQVSVSDGDHATLPRPAIISFTNLSNSLLLSQNNLTIEEGETVTLSAVHLSATDQDAQDPTLVFTVSDVQHGQFVLSSAPQTAITSFTQAQVIAGQVQFQHDGAAVAPNYKVSVSDGEFSTTPSAVVVNFTRTFENDAPRLLTNRLSIFESQSLIITTEHLQATDVDNDNGAIQYTMSDVQHGRFELITAPGISIAQFTQAQINSGVVQFVHDGGEDAPSYRVSVSDGVASTDPVDAEIVFIPVNDIPILENNQLDFNLKKTGPIVITEQQLSARDVDHVQTDLHYTVSEIRNGHFANKAALSTPITTFTPADVKAGSIYFVPDGSHQLPSYQVTVSDGVTSTDPAPASINDVTPQQVDPGSASRGAAIGSGIGVSLSLIAISVVAAGGYALYKRRKNAESRRNHKFADAIRQAMPLWGVANFNGRNGQRFRAAVDALIQELRNQGIDIDTLGLQEITELGHCTAVVLRGAHTKSFLFRYQVLIDASDIMNEITTIAQKVAMKYKGSTLFQRSSSIFPSSSSIYGGVELSAISSVSPSVPDSARGSITPMVS